MSLVEKALEKTKSDAARQLAAHPRPVAGGARADVSLLSQAVTPEPSVTPRQTTHVALDDLRRAGMLPPDAEWQRVANEFRAIKRGLLARFAAAHQAGQRGSAVMVASALPGEGKTFTSVNLAMSLATEKDQNVVLVDADVAKPHISRAFGLEKSVGLLEALARDELTLNDITVETDVPRFSIIPAGHPTPAATELLSSARMGRLVREALDAPSPTIFVFDSPPVLMTAEARALADAIGNVVLVVKAGSTQRASVTSAVAAIGEHKSISLILNQDSAKSEDSYYYPYGGGGQSTGNQM